MWFQGYVDLRVVGHDSFTEVEISQLYIFPTISMALDRQKATQFRNACAAFDITNSDAIASLSTVLNQLTADLARNDILRFVQSMDLLANSTSLNQTTNGNGRAAHMARLAETLAYYS